MVSKHPADDFVGELRQVLKGSVLSDDFSRGFYSTDASNFQIIPRVVVLPKDEKDVCEAVRIAVKHHVPILPRGGGTSLAGQTVTSGMVLDLSRHMNRILEINAEEKWVLVQPGVVLDECNAALHSHGLHFAPDPATGNRANIGGMIGNNSSGMRSIEYGKTMDHVLETRVLLASGDIVHFSANPRKGDPSWRFVMSVNTIISERKEEIKARFPKVMRRVSGYNLDEFLDSPDWNLSKLFAGSEGTLGIILSAKLKLVPLPRGRATCVAHFHGIDEALKAVKPIVKMNPSAVELLDAKVIQLARENMGSTELNRFFQGLPAAVLIIEAFGDSSRDALKKIEKIASFLLKKSGCYLAPAQSAPEDMAVIWDARKSGLGLIMGVPDDKKPVPFIEDACVPLESLPEYIDRLTDICHAHNTEVVRYAHASVGVLHMRPCLDLRKHSDIQKMKSIAKEAFELVKEYKGSWSGEHGDGLARSSFIESFFGPIIYEGFREIKHLFDPQGLMNPGKIIDAPPMDHHLRFGQDYAVNPWETAFHFRKEHGVEAAVHSCSGIGTCRKTLSGTMCPSYMVTKDEGHTPRARANILRLALSGQLGDDAFSDPGMEEVLDLCIGCKACKTECPSNVDIARLKEEFHHRLHGLLGVDRRDRLLAEAPFLAAHLSPAGARLANGFLNSKPGKWIQKRLGLADRPLPAFAEHPFKDNYHPGLTKNPVGTVVLFVDCFVNNHEPELGKHVANLLTGLGYTVEIAQAGCCQRTRISKGFLGKAKTEGEKTMRQLAEYAKEGLPIVVIEPGCASSLMDDLPDLLNDQQLGKKVADSVFLLEDFILKEKEAGRITKPLLSDSQAFIIHPHCHQKALFRPHATRDVLRMIRGAHTTELDAGCCGMAGSFGYEKEHLAISLKMGNRKLFPAISGADNEACVIATGFSCRHQISHGTGKKARHWAEAVFPEQ